MGALVGIGELIKNKTPGKRLLERGREGAELNQDKDKNKGVSGELGSSCRQSLAFFICSWEQQEEI